jgi:hypothetical protein
MMDRMKPTRLLRWGAIVMLTLALAPASTALARSSEPEKESYDARLEGYTTNPTIPLAGSGLTWIAMVVLGVLCCAGLFKDAKRTHLD